MCKEVPREQSQQDSGKWANQQLHTQATQFQLKHWFNGHHSDLLSLHWMTSNIQFSNQIIKLYYYRCFKHIKNQQRIRQKHQESQRRIQLNKIQQVVIFCNKFQLMSKETIFAQLKDKKIRQGLLLKRSKFLREWRQRWVVLTFNFMITFTNKSCKEITDVIDLTYVKSIKSYLNPQEEMMPAAFKIRSGDNQLYLCAKDTYEKWNWIVALERLMDFRNLANKNNIDYLQYATKTGFQSINDYFKQKQKKVEKEPTKQEKIKGPPNIQQIKKKLDQQSISIMKGLIKQQEQLKREKQNVKKQQLQISDMKEKYLLLEEKYQEQKHKLSQLEHTNLELQKKLKNYGITTKTQTVGRRASFRTSRKSRLEEIKNTRSAIVNNIFEQFIEDSETPEIFKYLIVFLVFMTTDKNYGYIDQFATAIKTHQNKFNFVQILLEILQNQHDFIQNNSRQVFKFVLLVFELNSSMFAFHQFQILKRIILHAISNNKTSSHLEILNLIIMLNEINPINEEQINEYLVKLIQTNQSEEIIQLAKTILKQ